MSLGFWAAGDQFSSQFVNIRTFGQILYIPYLLVQNPLLHTSRLTLPRLGQILLQPHWLGIRKPLIPLIPHNP
jgi:hypothetical protein